MNPENRLVNVKKDTKKEAKPEEIETINNNLIDKSVDITNPTNTTNTVKHTCTNFENLVSATTVAGYEKPKGTRHLREKSIRSYQCCRLGHGTRKAVP